MRIEYVFLVTCLALVGFGIALLAQWLHRRHAEAMAQLDILRAALQRPDLDAGTREQMMALLTAAQVGRGSRLKAVVQVAWMGSGWLLFVFGGIMLLLRWWRLVPFIDSQSIATMVAAGFAMITLPIGLRELRRRNRGADELPSTSR